MSKEEDIEAALGWLTRIEELATEMASLRATIADLEKRLENAVEIDWDDADRKEGAEVCGWVPVAMYRDQSGFVRRGIALGAMIPRPDPAKLTPEQMAEAWMLSHGYDIESDIGRAAGEGALLGAILKSGKSIEELYNEMIKG